MKNRFVWVLGVAAVSSVPALGQEKRPIPQLRVTGRAEVRAKPEIAVISLGVVTQAEKAAEAGKQNAELMSKVMDAVKKAGVAESDLQTSGYSLQPIYDQRPNQAPKIVRYSASNQLSVIVRKLPNAGAVIDAGLTAGANSFNGISWDSKDRAPKDQALAQAMEDAKRKAQIMAKALDQGLLGALEVIEGGAQHVMPQPVFAAMRGVEGGAATPVAPGELTFTADVTVVFALASEQRRAEALTPTQAVLIERYLKALMNEITVRDEFGVDHSKTVLAYKELNQTRSELAAANLPVVAIQNAVADRLAALLDEMAVAQKKYSETHPIIRSLQAKLDSLRQVTGGLLP